MPAPHIGDPLADLEDLSPTMLVRTLLEDRQAEVESWEVEPAGGGASSSQVYFASGQARSRRRSIPYSLVIKTFGTEGEAWRATSEELGTWDYWKREWLVYAAPWLPGLPGRVVPPRVLAVGAQSGQSVWAAMEDLRGLDHRPWPLERFGAVARHAGELTGGLLTDQTSPTESWLTASYLRGWTARSAPMVELLPSVADDPVVRQMYDARMIDDLQRLWERREDVYAALDALPQTFCHQDLFPRNAFLRSVPGGEQTVAIDWGCCGPGPVGTELVALVGASLIFFEYPPEQADQVERECLRNFRAGLADAGYLGDLRDVEFGYLASLVLRFGVGSVGPTLTVALDERLHPVVEQIFGHDITAFADNTHALMRFMQPRIARVLDEVGRG